MAARVCEYATPTFPLVSDVVLITSGCGVMVRVRLAVAAWVGDAESVTLNVSGVAVTATPGVPLITPVDAFSDNPDGSVPPVSAQVKGVMPPAA